MTLHFSALCYVSEDNLTNISRGLKVDMTATADETADISRGPHSIVTIQDFFFHQICCIITRGRAEYWGSWSDLDSFFGGSSSDRRSFFPADRDRIIDPKYQGLDRKWSDFFSDPFFGKCTNFFIMSDWRYFLKI